MSMILDDFLVKNDRGLYCKYGNFYLDAIQATDQVIVSHGHGDHVVAGCNRVFCTAPTAAFMVHRFGRNAGRAWDIHAYGTTFSINEVAITLYPAGHIMGSAMVLMVYKGIRYLYTGDYKLQHDSTCEPANLIEADVLITESTFANPAVRHPDPILEINKLNETHFPILLGAYALGKAQRLTALINQHCPQKEVLIHHSVLPFHRIYEAHCSIDWRYMPYSRKAMKQQSEQAVYVVPPLTFNSYLKAKNVIKIFASGWMNLQRGNDMALFISDHVDWQDILTTIAHVKPTEIWTLHGDGSALLHHYEGQIKVKLL